MKRCWVFLCFLAVSLPLSALAADSTETDHKLVAGIRVNAGNDSPAKYLMPLTIMSSVGISGLLASALVFLAKGWISERLKSAIKLEYDEKLETHKAQLRRAYDREIEQLKAQLQIAAAERNIRLSRVFERTADTVATTYAKLSAFHEAAKDFTQPLVSSDDSQRSELGMVFQSKSNDFLQYYLPRKIYLPNATAERIRVFSNTLHSLVRTFTMALAAQKAHGKNPVTIESLHKRLDELQGQVPELLELLEEDFQRILGLEERKTAADVITSGQASVISSSPLPAD